MRYKKKKVESPEELMGKVVDLPLADFERELIEQKVNIGMISNLILNLESIYFELRTRKDAVIDLVFKGGKSKDDPEIRQALDGLYAEMTKTEQKITFLKQRKAELIDVG